MPRSKYSDKEYIIKIKEKFGIDVNIAIKETGTYAIFECVNHGEQETDMKYGMGYKYLCRNCGKDARNEKNIKNAIEQRVHFVDVVNQAQIIHGDTFHYIGLTYGRKKIATICKIHGYFEIFKSAHLKGTGCPTCYKEAQIRARTYVQNKYEEDKIKRKVINLRGSRNRQRREKIENVLSECREKHGDKFEYEFSNYTGRSGEFDVICRKHGKNRQIIYEHLKSKYGCRECAKYCVSVSELDWLSSLGITDRQKIIFIGKKKYKVDGYDPSTNTIYEYLGAYWHGHPSRWECNVDSINPTSKIKFVDLFIETKDRLEKLSKEGYNIVYRWDIDDINKVYINSDIFVKEAMSWSNYSRC